MSEPTNSEPVIDLSNMTFPELLHFTEEQAALEESKFAGYDDPEGGATWKEILAVFRYMQEHGVPEPLLELRAVGDVGRYAAEPRR